ncbi:unnamed protein product [Notodromas monacha]|nr:unnamed protein product [Notodromas monacha]CAG0922666.1 unnamed protein product [Notodromas monacha]
MTPTEEESNLRMRVIQRIRDVILSLWPDVESVQVFGSFRTGLYLPTSDIDLVVMGTFKESPLHVLEKALIEHEIAIPSGIKVLDKASVPIIKVWDKESKIRVDISFNMRCAVNVANLIRSFKESFPVLPHLVLVLKQFLMQRDMNEVFTGGISSYSLILMTVNFLQLHPHLDAVLAKPGYLGVLLLEFLELYGQKFNYLRTGIRVADGGSYVCKKEKLEETRQGPSMLYIEDPLIPGNDIGRGSYGALLAKVAFRYAYSTLLAACSSFLSANLDCDKYSLLGRIIVVTDDVVMYREWIKETFPLTDESRVDPSSIGFCTDDPASDPGTDGGGGLGVGAVSPSPHSPTSSGLSSATSSRSSSTASTPPPLSSSPLSSSSPPPPPSVPRLISSASQLTARMTSSSGTQRYHGSNIFYVAPRLGVSRR